MNKKLLSYNFHNSPFLGNWQGNSHFIKFNPVNLFLLGFGAIITVYAYGSIVPLIPAASFHVLGQSILFLTPLGGIYERRMFNRVFAVCFFMAGIAAIYANKLNDPFQLASDASNFFHLSTFSPSDMTLGELRHITGGSLAVWLWRWIYNFYSCLGVPASRSIGITVNIVEVALTGVVGIKGARLLYGNDRSRFQQLILLVSMCPILWLFAGIYLRDALVLLVTTVLAYFWVSFFVKYVSGWRFVVIIAWSTVFSFLFIFLRTGFVMMPLAIAFMGVGGWVIGRKQGNKVIIYLLVLIGLLLTIGCVVYFANSIFDFFQAGHKGYLAHSLRQHSRPSLGLKLIVKQPLPLRIILGSIYLFIFPIPLWSGFQLNSAYHLFKSMNALYCYFFLPLLFISVYQLTMRKTLHKPEYLFLYFLAFGFLASIAYTSLETRHLGAMMMPFFWLALLPEIGKRKTQKKYKLFLCLTICGIITIHCTWAIVKFF